MRAQVADVTVHVRRLAAQVDQDEPGHRRYAYRDQAPASGVEVHDVVHVPRAVELAVEPVGPGVIGADDATPHGALGVREQPRPAVTADVEESVRATIRASHHDDAVGPDLAHHIAPG